MALSFAKNYNVVYTHVATVRQNNSVIIQRIRYCSTPARLPKGDLVIFVISGKFPKRL